MDIKLLKKIKSKLPRGGVKKIAIQTGLSECMVRKVLNGERKNEIVIEKAIEVAKEEKIKQKIIKTKIAKL